MVCGPVRRACFTAHHTRHSAPRSLWHEHTCVLYWVAKHEDKPRQWTLEVRVAPGGRGALGGPA